MTMDFKEVLAGRRTTHMNSAPSGMPVVQSLSVSLVAFPLPLLLTV